MLKLVEALDKARYTPRIYVAADTDKMSRSKAAALEDQTWLDGADGKRRAVKSSIKG